MATDDREKSTLVVEVEAYCDDDFMSPCYLEIELGDNEGVTCFAPGTDAYFRVYGNIVYSCKATLGSPSVDNRGCSETISEEYIDFTNWQGSATYPIHALKSSTWIGKSLGGVHFQQGSTSLIADLTKLDGFGVLKVAYTTKFDRWRITSSDEGDIIAYVVGTGVCSDTKASLSIQIRDDCAGVQNNYVTLTFKNYITNESIVGVNVIVDGVQRGITDSNGQIYLGLMISGTHTLKGTHPSYSGTEADLLGNDSFVVSG